MKNNKGFLLAESLIVTTFVLTLIIYLFVQFKGLVTEQKRSYSYNNVENIYDLGSIAQYLKESDQVEGLNQNLKTSTNSYITIFKDNSCQNLSELDVCTTLGRAMDLEFMIYTDSNINTIKSYIKTNNDANINQDMKDFISKVSATKIVGKGRLVAKFKNGNFATIAIETEKLDEGEIIYTALYVGSFGNDETGHGTLDNPYATITKAYQMASEDAVIYIIDDIVQIDTTKMEDDKNITITSCDETGAVDTRINTVKRNNTLTDSMIKQTAGSLTLKNIKFDGDNVSALEPLLNISSQVTIEKGTTITNNKNTSALDSTHSEGGGILNTGVLIINDGIISNNASTNRGSGGILNKGTLNINGGIISGNTASLNGGGIESFSGTLSLSGGEISGNSANVKGGGISIRSSSTLTMTAGTISNNTATTFGGGISNDKAIITISGGTISNNKADRGGGVYGTINSTISISNGNIINNNATNTGPGGGGIAADGTLKITGGTISSNKSDGTAGGIWVGNVANITGGTISNNTAESFGGGVNVTYHETNNTSANATFKNVEIKNNKAQYGGGITVNNYGDHTPTATINSGTTISNNEATAASSNGGGGIHIKDGTLKFKNGIVDGNASATYGGGIASEGVNAKLEMTGGTIKNNTANGTGGGGIANVSGSVFKMTGGTISSNTARGGGGGLLNHYNSSATLSGGIISSNNVTSNSSIGGGGVYTNGTLSIKGVVIDNNLATGPGGGVGCSTSGKVTMTSGEISNNTASDYGGGITLANGSSISGGEIRFNYSPSGGGVYQHSGTNTISGTTDINNNFASSDLGGGIYVGSGTLKLTGGTISNNTAYNWGGGIHVNAGALNITGSTVKITNNTATNYGGGGINTGGTVTMSAGEISGNKAPKYDGGGVRIGSTGTFNLSGGTIKNNSANTKGGISNGGTYNRSGSPTCSGNTPNNVTAKCIIS